MISFFIHWPPSLYILGLSLGWLLCLWVCFSGLFMVWFLGFIFCFSGDGDWIWLLDLDLGFAKIGLVVSWTWKEHEEYFLLVFNLNFSSFHLCSTDMALSSWLLGSCSCDG